MEMKAMSLDEFTRKTAGKDAVPGGGSVAALTGAIGASLSAMVASLTVDKAGYEGRRDEMESIISQAEKLRERLLCDIDRDCTSFDGYIKALSLPKATEEEKAARQAAMQLALKEAAQVPLEIAGSALEIMPLAKAAVLYGNKNAVTDGVIAAMMARTAVLSALCNVKINLASIKDKEFTDKVWVLVRQLESNALSMEAQIIADGGM